MLKPNDDIENQIFEVERHCNNYFNPCNDPNDPTRNYPPAFLDLVNKIIVFNEGEHENKTSITSYSEGSVSMSRDINTSWQNLFSRELSIYKRAKFI
jgi:hypothetical protein